MIERYSQSHTLDTSYQYMEVNIPLIQLELNRISFEAAFDRYTKDGWEKYEDLNPPSLTRSFRMRRRLND
jgi:hypothetical protein